jgi:putative flippase GtrA
MLALVLILHVFIGSTIAGSCVIAALVLGYDTLIPIVVAAAVGFVAAFPVSYSVARALYGTR